MFGGMTNSESPDKKFELTPESKRPWYKKKKIVIPLAIFVIAIGASTSEESSVETVTSPTNSSVSEEATKTVVESEPETLPVGEFGNYPPEQQRFLEIVEAAKTEIDNAETDLQESVALRNRDKALCAELSANKASNWTGIIKTVGANGEGKAYVDIEIADRIRVQTWNNAFSDIGDNTLIPTSSKFFNDLVAMAEGDLVTFSATFLRGSNSCLKKGNLTDVFYGISPEFIVRFNDIKKG